MQQGSGTRSSFLRVPYTLVFQYKDQGLCLFRLGEVLLGHFVTLIRKPGKKNFGDCFGNIIQRCSMNGASSSSMEEIPLDDVDRNSMEYRMLMAYAQRRLSASKYEQLLKEEAKSPGGTPLYKEDTQAGDPVHERKKLESSSPEDQKQPAKNWSQKKRKKKTMKSTWKHLLFPSCLRAQIDEEAPQRLAREDTVNGYGFMECAHATPLPEAQGTCFTDDPAITLVAARLAEIIDNSRSSEQDGFKALAHSESLEEDGGWTSEARLEDVDGKDDEEKIINTIVAFLRKSGDELQTKIEKDKSFLQRILDLMSYTFYRRVTNQFLGDALAAGSTMDSEIHVQRTKIALAMEVTARLSVLGSHPMNIVLGFGTKYLKDHFSPWIHSQGGWEKALGLPDQEEVE
ncbi:apoptosis facilitator Bcl-2-like protein 14 [Pogona vitticeps]